jgi:hypothetical protein
MCENFNDIFVPSVGLGVLDVRVLMTHLLDGGLHVAKWLDDQILQAAVTTVLGVLQQVLEDQLHVGLYYVLEVHLVRDDCEDAHERAQIHFLLFFLIYMDIEIVKKIECL